MKRTWARTSFASATWSASCIKVLLPANGSIRLYLEQQPTTHVPLLPKGRHTRNNVNATQPVQSLNPRPHRRIISLALVSHRVSLTCWPCSTKMTGLLTCAPTAGYCGMLQTPRPNWDQSALEKYHSWAKASTSKNKHKKARGFRQCGRYAGTKKAVGSKRTTSLVGLPFAYETF